MKAGSSGGLSSGLVWNLGSAILPLIGSFLVSVLLFPYLGRQATGRYILVMSAATFFLIVGKFGIQAAASRLVSEHEDRPGPWIRAALALRGLFTLPTALIALLVSAPLARFIDGDALVDPFYLVAAVIVAASSYELTGEILVGLRRYPLLLGVRVVFLALRIAVVLWVRSAGWGVVTFLAGHAVSQLVTSAGVWSWLLRRFPTGGVDGAQARRRMFSISFPLALSSASFLVYAQTDKLMVGWLKDAATAGDFGVARTVLDAALFPTFAIAWTLRPALIRALKDGHAPLFRLRLRTGLLWSAAFAVGGGAALYWIGPPLVVALYGRTFSTSADLLRWMAPILFLRGVGTVVFPVLLATDRQSTYARLMALTAALNVAANLLLIPPLGAVGAILATIASLVPLSLGGLAIVRSITRELAPGRASSNST